MAAYRCKAHICGQIRYSDIMPFAARYKPWQRDCMHAYSFELNISSESRPGFLQRFGNSDNENMNIGMDVKDLSEGL